MEIDEAILKQVKAALARETHLDPQAHPVALEAVEGRLLIEGEVPDVAAKKRALRAAAAVLGAGDAIVDRLRVKPAERTSEGATRDAVCKLLLRDVDFRNCTLRVQAKGRLETLREPMGDTCGAIEVAVEDGVVTLTGRVISLSHKRLAGLLAWWARGCRDVVNALEVVPAEEDNDDEITDALRLALETDPHVHADQIGISTRNRVITLDGVVASEQERRRAEADAWCLFAVDEVINRIEVRA
jgi:osmotically-inducible protein OsmY